jgi:hypothetical protein
MAWSVDRLGRSLQDLVGFLSELHALRIDLFLHQQGLDTTTPAGKAMFQMMGVFAEFTNPNSATDLVGVALQDNSADWAHGSQYRHCSVWWYVLNDLQQYNRVVGCQRGRRVTMSVFGHGDGNQRWREDQHDWSSHIDQWRNGK